MSHFALRVGELLHIHPFAHVRLEFLAIPKRRTRAGNVPGGAPPAPEDLAFFGLCKESQAADRRVEMDRYSLMSSDDENSGGLDETVLYLP